MSHNPLLGNRISLISKKNIRYEGTLYSINEADATVALADVRSFGTEGREKLDSNAAYVPPQDVVHPYLLFRGCDIKDLHVHERKESREVSDPPEPPPDPAILSTEVPPEVQKKQQKHQQQENTENLAHDKVKKGEKTTSPDAKMHDQKEGSKASPVKNTLKQDESSIAGGPAYEISRSNQGSSTLNKDTRHDENNDDQGAPRAFSNKKSSQPSQRRQPNHNRRGHQNRNQFSRGPRNQVGTGESLLHRKARGAVEGGIELATGEDFDFESSAAEFDRERTSIGLDGNENGTVGIGGAYSKDDFFDNISCDASDKRDGIDNRLRGAAERNLNTETFGAVSLGSNRRGGRRNRRRGGGRYGGGRSGRGAGRFSRPPVEENRRWKEPDHSSAQTARA